MKITITNAQPHDADQLVAHQQQLIMEPGVILRPTPQIPTSFTPEHTRLMVQETRDRIARITASHDALMLAAAIDWARAHDKIDRLTLSVMTANAPALRLYRKHGFQTPRKPYTLPQYPDTQLVTMTLPLNT